MNGWVTLPENGRVCGLVNLIESESISEYISSWSYHLMVVIADTHKYCDKCRVIPFADDEEGLFPRHTNLIPKPPIYNFITARFNKFYFVWEFSTLKAVLPQSHSNEPASQPMNQLTCYLSSAQIPGIYLWLQKQQRNGDDDDDDYVEVFKCRYYKEKREEGTNEWGLEEENVLGSSSFLKFCTLVFGLALPRLYRVLYNNNNNMGTATYVLL